MNYDFAGIATKANVKCGDGRIILKGAFQRDDGRKVPLVWQHGHKDIKNTLGHAVLRYVPETGDVRCECYLNDSEEAKHAKTVITHGDIDSLSIWANDLVEKSLQVIHGVIREVSLVLSGQNPGAKIDNIVIHGASDGYDEDETIYDPESAIIYSGEGIELPGKNVSHGQTEAVEEESEETVKDVYETLTPKQKKAVEAIFAEAMSGDNADHSAVPEGTEETSEEVSHSKIQEEGEIMKINAFDAATNTGGARAHLSHAQLDQLFATAKDVGSLKKAFFAHAGTYGIDNIEYLFPDAQAVTSSPTFIQRDQTWVSRFWGRAKKLRFSRIKSVHADITPDEARARGYVKGALKIEEVFELLKRTTDPTTVYKKQKLDREDLIDITDLDVVAWLKSEMRMMLDEEIARAGLVGDGRDPVGDAANKIPETKIRPIYKDDVLYTVRLQLPTATTPLEMVDAIVGSFADYKGTGSPIMYTTSALLTSLLLLRDTTDRRLYRTKAELAAELMVDDIVTVPVMENLAYGGHDLKAIIVNPADYSYGADRGGEVSMFDDFDIDYNQFKYLIEARCSGALTIPYSAIVVETVTA